jgi:hypothetical protein
VPDFRREPARISTSIYEFHFDGSDTATGVITNDRFDYHHDHHHDYSDHHDAAPHAHHDHVQWSDHHVLQLRRDDPWGQRR